MRSSFRVNGRAFDIRADKHDDDEDENNSDGSNLAELFILDEIGEPGFWFDAISANDVISFLNQLPKSVNQIDVHINSPGGSVSHGNTIHNALANHPANITVKVDGFALSAASVIAMAGDEIQMAANAMMMIHRSGAFTMGNIDDHTKTAELLGKIDTVMAVVYAARTGVDQVVVHEMLVAETWMTADEAKDLGFADTVLSAKTKPKDSSAQWTGGSHALAAYKKLPESLAKVVANEREQMTMFQTAAHQSRVDDDLASQFEKPTNSPIESHAVKETPLSKLVDEHDGVRLGDL